ncbi:MAG: cobaltochelatase subunit CobS [Rickettsiales bacterium]|nr:cobaltochelatase subunit CobS [Rickettsiales bacterium]|tara:strand:- start:835 stop:1854 length:1020 start_codon:yes stop_codon:yes gene_type:complete
MKQIINKKINERSDVPDKESKASLLFNIDTDMTVPCFANKDDYVPEIDKSYIFDKDTTLSILAGFKYNRRVMIQGYHGTGKSTHIEQIAARLNWRCLRINLDSHVSRIDLIGKDAIVLEKGVQITKFKEGIIPWALQSGTALVFDEYDAGRPDVMFVIQRILEIEGKLTLLEQNRVINPHSSFRLFCTTNTIGLGDTSGLYHGTQQINQGQMDRWNIVSTLNYLPKEQEFKIICSKVKEFLKSYKEDIILSMIELANLTRAGFKNGDISTLMSPRTVITWAENTIIFGDLNYAFKVTFLNKCDEAEKSIIAEYYQRCLAIDIPEQWLNNLEEKNTNLNE